MKHKRGESRHSPRRIEAVTRQAAALEYRRQGLPYIRIAQLVGLNSAQAAWSAVESALLRMRSEPAQAARMLDAERLDELFVQVFPAACEGHVPSIDSALAIMKRRAALLGLDAPMRHELTGASVENRAVPPCLVLVSGPVVLAGQS